MEKKILKDYSNKLIVEFGKKYNERTLRRIRQYYRLFKDEKWSTMSTALTWSHYTELLPIKNKYELMYYLDICTNKNMSVRELREIIKNKEYERLPESTKNKLIVKEKNNITDFVKNPIIIKKTGNFETISEKILQRLILEDIPSFLKELGSGFTFIDNEYKIKLGDRYNSLTYFCLIMNLTVS